jgi:hypothetical protein
MAQQREATTDRLVGIIANIKMERRSGQLTVRRGEGLTSEEGTLTFQQGQITRANVGRRSGSDALNWLSTWGRARYIFIPTVSEAEVPGTFSSLPSSSPGARTTNPAFPVTRVHTDRLESTRSPALAYGVPRATVELSEAAERIEQAGLSRAHRRLYLLIDGQRAAIELVPLLGKKAEEVRNMLQDLEWLGVIRISNLPPAKS